MTATTATTVIREGLASALTRTKALLPRRADFAPVRRKPKRDLLAGVTVAVVALPLALAFGITSGVGAAAGLVTAVVAGAVAAFFGGSNLQVSGPTGAMTVVLVPIVALYGSGGVPVVGMLAGLVLLVLAYVGAGRSMRYVPLPHVPTVPMAHLGALMVPAVAVAALASLESLLCATVADGMTVGERHDPNRELFGQGLANLAAPLFGGIPATAAIARTAVNVRSGGRSRLAALTHSVVLLLIMGVAARWVSTIPLAALAGVLLATAVQMIEVSSLAALLRATRGDAAVLVVTAVATVAFDLVTAVILGLVVAGVVALKQMAGAVRVEEVPLDVGDHDAEEQELLAEHIVAYRLDGPLFFGAAHTFLLELSEVSDVRVVVLRMSRIASLDATCASVLADTVKRLEARGTTVLLSGVRPVHTHVLRQLGVYDGLAHERHVFGGTPEAIAHARVHAARVQHEAVAEADSAAATGA